jgi:hypothetical protein
VVIGFIFPARSRPEKITALARLALLPLATDVPPLPETEDVM